MKKIRTLTGTKATDYQRQLDAKNVHVNINLIQYLFLQLRTMIYQTLGFEQHYFIVRHHYSPSDRRLLDLLYISSRDGSLGDKPTNLSAVDTIRFKRLLSMYKDELNIKHEWVRVTARDDKNLKFVWHKDIDKYNDSKP